MFLFIFPKKDCNKYIVKTVISKQILFENTTTTTKKQTKKTNNKKKKKQKNKRKKTKKKRIAVRTYNTWLAEIDYEQT